jgi:glucosamine kinase
MNPVVPRRNPLESTFDIVTKQTARAEAEASALFCCGPTGVNESITDWRQSVTAATNARTIGLGLDAGGTATRWHLADVAGTTTATGGAGPLTGLIYGDAAKRAAGVTLDEIAMAVLAHGRPTHILAGITGLDEDTEAAHFFADALAARFALSSDAVRIENDMGIAYRAACAPGTGILVYSGTGSVACHVTRAGEHIRVGGRGVVIDDGGSGFWVAKEAIKALFRIEDRAPGAGWATPLGQALAESFGGATWDHARTFIYGGDRGRIATLARHVATAAHAGDGVATGVLEAAGRELADLASALVARLGPREAVLAGGTTRIHPSLVTAFAAALPTGVPHRHATTLDPARAAALAAVQGT